MTVLFTAQFLSGQLDVIPGTIHLLNGYLLLTVVLFRIQWGIWGSQEARFAHMLAGPRAIIGYLPRLFSRTPTRWPGHNPVGAISAVLILALLLGQCITGLFVETWGEMRGPLAERVSRDTAIVLTDLHELMRWLLLGFVILHVSAVLFYYLVKREDRITPIFVHGRLELDEPSVAGQRPGPIRLWLSLLSSAAIVAAIAWLGPIA